MIKHILVAIATLFALTCNAQKKITVGFYNVENLFDTVNDPQKNDEEFLPDGKMKWDDTRFNQKLSNISKVMSAIDTKFPSIMGFCEIENRFVLEKLIEQNSLKKAGYQIVHFDSPDDRGIDVGLIFKKKDVKFHHAKSYRIVIENEPDFKTRDILVFSGILMKNKKDTIHVLVNHWPSRRGGEKSEIKRTKAGETARYICDSLMARNMEAKIILMGDFNDEPTDKSVYEALGAREVDSGFNLLNLMLDKQKKKEGSHFYKGEYSTLDQLIVSKSLLQPKGFYTKPENAMIGNFDFLLFTNKEGQKQPNRTYVGDKFVGGYSDHLPVYLELIK
jgi:predicted extracellular nuclease